MTYEEQKKLLNNIFYSLFMLLNPYRIYFYLIEIFYSINLAFKLLFDALRLYIKSLAYLLIPLLVLTDFQLYQPALTHFISTHIHENMGPLIQYFIHYLILWPYLVSPIYLALYHAKMETTPVLKDLLKSSHQHFFKIILLRLLIFSVTVIILIIIFSLYFYMMPNGGAPIHFSYKSFEPTYHLTSNYLVGHILLFISLYNCVYLLLRLLLAEWLIVLKGYGPIQAIKESWQSMSGRVSTVFFSFIIMSVAAILLPRLLHTVLPQYSVMIEFIVMKLFGVFYFAVMICLYDDSQGAYATSVSQI